MTDDNEVLRHRVFRSTYDHGAVIIHCYAPVRVLRHAVSNMELTTPGECQQLLRTSAVKRASGVSQLDGGVLQSGGTQQ